MFLQRLLRPTPVKVAAERLYAAAVGAARAPALYVDLGVPDTADGRFELYTLFVLLVIERLRAEGKTAAPLSQAVFDAYLAGLDHGLRELAVGDLSVSKTMRRLGEAFYGRGKSLDVALAALPDETPLVELVGRTVFSGAAGADPKPLAARILSARAALADTPIDDLARGDLAIA
jgi:cytochrome b pre-mRNA-processing protein 3